MSHPTCWMCGSTDVKVDFTGYKTVYCVDGCTEDHAHESDVPQAKLSCRGCGNVWDDGSGDFAERS